MGGDFAGCAEDPDSDGFADDDGDAEVDAEEAEEFVIFRRQEDYPADDSTLS
ncbi:MAG: hypothetical protein IT167_08440 [Bryobacterales bacterium]|nr:hypothetical protein [Bryobacterales bacterium]